MESLASKARATHLVTFNVVSYYCRLQVDMSVNPIKYKKTFSENLDCHINKSSLSVVADCSPVKHCESTALTVILRRVCTMLQCCEVL